MSRIMFFIAILLLYLSVNVYVCVRGMQALSGLGTLRIVFLVTFILAALSFIISIPLENYLPLKANFFIQTIGNSWLLIVFYCAVILLVFDVFRLANHFLHFFPKVMTVNWETTKLIAFGFTTILLTVVCSLGYMRFSNPQIKELEISVDKTCSDKELTVVAISDVHLGFTIGKNRLQSYVEKINSLQPDIVLIAGDLFDRNIRPVMQQKLNEDLRRISSTYGVYAVYGNHEYYGHISTTKEKDVQDFLTSTGICFLKDSVIHLENGMSIIGRDDMTNSHRKSINALMADVDTEKPVLMMDHQPYHLEEAEENGVDLQISGHTHAGQVFPGNHIVNKIYELGYGYKTKGATHYYVSSGLGLWGPPFRIGTKS
ncbi:metallophosphoesterase, partial [Bacteroidales bacterium OttesenSCG-928-C19]|nr:metallophosphoesterase [Bacteroidales bacterium OttesenSCG-928-C19]